MAIAGTQVRSAGDARTWARWVVVAGWVAKGAVYAAVAWLVLQLALGGSPQEASPAGALEYIATTGPGTWALVIVGLGLLAYAAGRVLEVTVLATDEVDAKERVLAAVATVVYLALAVSAFAIVASAGGSAAQGEQAPREVTARLLDRSWGPWLVGLGGLVLAAVAAVTVHQGVTRAYLRTLRTGEMSPAIRRVAEAAGTAAYVTKGVVVGLLAWFTLQAALTHDPGRSKGLDGALREVADSAWGTALLVAVAVGLLAYAVFCELEARYRRIGSGATGT